MRYLQTLIIPKYITKIQMSKKRRKRYYKKGKNGWKPRDLPKTYQEKVDKGEWTISSKGYLCVEDGSKKIANPQAAGTPRYEALSGNSLMTGYGSYHTRNKITEELKKFYRKPVRNQLKPIKFFPLIITWDFYTTLGEANWDLDNMFFYWKYLQDVLVDQNIIPDDTVEYITYPPSARMVPVENWEDRKFVFKFYQDERRLIHATYKDHNLL
jgi:hypothetical protein